MTRAGHADVQRTAETIGKALDLPVVDMFAGSGTYVRPWVIEFRAEGEGYPEPARHRITTHYAYSAKQVLHYLAAYMEGIMAGSARERGEF